MNKFLSLAGLALILAVLTQPVLTHFPTLEHSAKASILGAPYLPEIDARFNCLESNTGCTGYPGFAAGSITNAMLSGSISFSKFLTGYGADGNFPMSIWKTTLNMVQAAATYTTDITIPAKSIIKRAEMYVHPAVTPSGTTLAVQCVGANDIYSTTSVSTVADNGFIDGVEQGVAANMLFVSSACAVKFLIGTHTGTAGSIELLLEVYQTP